MLCAEDRLEVVVGPGLQQPIVDVLHGGGASRTLCKDHRRSQPIYMQEDVHVHPCHCHAIRAPDVRMENHQTNYSAHKFPLWNGHDLPLGDDWSLPPKSSEPSPYPWNRGALQRRIAED